MADNGMDYEPNGDHFEDDGPRYERDQRSASPRRGDDGHDNARRRSASPSGNGDRAAKEENGSTNDDGTVNPGSNLFVTGIHPRLTESEVTRLFEKYGEVEKCQIMRDPHTKESRGFGFVKMVTSDQADAAKEGLQGEMVEGRTFSIEKARRARPRTPTPGKYFGPPKREGRGGGRFEDRRPGGYGGGGGGRGGYGRDDPYRYRGGYDRGGYDRRDYDRGYDRGYREPRDYDRSYRGEDRGYDRGNSSGGGGGGGGGGGSGGSGGYDRRDDGYGRIDRYAGGRDERDRFGGREDRRGGGGGGGGSFDRDRDYRGDRGDRDGPRSREAPAAAGGYGDSGSRGGEGRDQYGGGSRD